jgi:hypothetical protein
VAFQKNRNTWVAPEKLIAAASYVGKPNELLSSLIVRSVHLEEVRGSLDGTVDFFA